MKKFELNFIDAAEYDLSNPANYSGGGETGNTHDPNDEREKPGGNEGDEDEIDG